MGNAFADEHFPIREGTVWERYDRLVSLALSQNPEFGLVCANLAQAEATILAGQYGS